MDEVGTPVKWERLGDTKWYKVTTSANRTYYYNRASKESRWERPDVGVPEAPPEPAPQEPPAAAQRETENTVDAIAGYKALIKRLNLKPTDTFDSAMPRLVFDENFKRIPQEQRRRLFDKLRRELLKESSRSIREISKEYMASDAGTRCDPQKPTDKDGDKPLKEGQTVKEGTKRHIPGPPVDRSAERATIKRKQQHVHSSKDAMASEMARTAFLSLLHEKVKMPFANGEVQPMDEFFIEGDPRSQSPYLHDREGIYLEFVSEFLESRIALFEEKLASLGSNNLLDTLDEVIDILGPRLFGQLPRDRLRSCLRRWRHSTENELKDSFNVLLWTTLYYAEGTPESRLPQAIEQIHKDKRELADEHRNSRAEY
ncbi:hypothetical protein BgAZ_201220 [Babesia gibsoni]|uniref:WW domain-containing protein n=1 Tax=Babesia gibsoni TaxID=33632 RepID=A0AAD8LQW2_BABGI|nr:hypothetical protein BgAZ_201220 [Babesia gibsoni]